MREKMKLLKIRTFGEFFTDSFELFKVGFRPLVKLFGIVCVPVIVISYFLANFFSVDAEELAEMIVALETMELSELSDFFGTIALSSSMSLLLFAAIMFVILTVSIIGSGYLVIYERAENPAQITYEQLLQLVKDNIFTFLFLTLLQSLMLAGWVIVSLIIGGILFAIGMFVTWVFYIILGLFSITAYAILVYFGTGLSYCGITILREKLSAVDSIKRSLKLIKGHWWYTFCLSFVGIIIVLFLQLPFQAPEIIYLFLKTDGLGVKGMPQLEKFIQASLSSLAYVGTFFSIVLQFMMALKYYDIIEKKEAVGINSKIDELMQQDNE